MCIVGLFFVEHVLKRMIQHKYNIKKKSIKHTELCVESFSFWIIRKYTTYVQKYHHGHTRQLSSLSIWIDICHVWMKMYGKKGEKLIHNVFVVAFPFLPFFFGEWFFTVISIRKYTVWEFEVLFRNTQKNKLCCILSDRITGTIYALALEYIFRLKVFSYVCFSFFASCLLESMGK